MILCANDDASPKLETHFSRWEWLQMWFSKTIVCLEQSRVDLSAGGLLAAKIHCLHRKIKIVSLHRKRQRNSSPICDLCATGVCEMASLCHVLRLIVSKQYDSNKLCSPFWIIAIGNWLFALVLHGSKFRDYELATLYGSDLWSNCPINKSNASKPMDLCA